MASLAAIHGLQAALRMVFEKVAALEQQLAEAKEAQPRAGPIVAPVATSSVQMRDVDERVRLLTDKALLDLRTAQAKERAVFETNLSRQIEAAVMKLVSDELEKAQQQQPVARSVVAAAPAELDDLSDILIASNIAPAPTKPAAPSSGNNKQSGGKGGKN